MKKLVIGMLTIMLLALAGCGDGDHAPPPLVTTQILSDPALDGDIVVDGTGTFTVTQGMRFPDIQSVFAGVDPATFDEFRAFLDFPLGGAGGVPVNAAIDSAFLDIFIKSIFIQPPTGTIPVRIDLVSFPPPLLATDFDLSLQPALASITVPILQSDFGQHVVIDVTPLMREAQLRGLPDFQVRILEDFSTVVPGLMEIDNTTASLVDRQDFAPLLEVTYF